MMMINPGKKIKKTEKQEPQRTCIACREVKPKRQLVRLVRTPEAVVVDHTGKTSGRGAYICRKAVCWEKALQGNRLEHTLKTRIKKDNLEQLTAQGAALLKEISIGQGE